MKSEECSFEDIIKNYMEITDKHREEYRKRFNTDKLADISLDMTKMIMTDESFLREVENLMIIYIYEGLNKNKEKYEPTTDV